MDSARLARYNFHSLLSKSKLKRCSVVGYTDTTQSKFTLQNGGGGPETGTAWTIIKQLAVGVTRMGRNVYITAYKSTVLIPLISTVSRQH